MKAARIHHFGPPEVIVVEETPRPVPAAGELLVRVIAAGVGPWGALIREGKSKVSPPPPLTLGSDLSGVFEEIAPASAISGKATRFMASRTLSFAGRRRSMLSSPGRW